MPLVHAVAPGILAADTITKLPPDASGQVVVSGSHGGRYPGYLAAKAGLRAVILNDAGVGKDAAGIGALAYLDALGIAAAAVSHESCRIGDTGDMIARGRISVSNDAAAQAGVRPQMACLEAAVLLTGAPHIRATDAPPVGEGRSEIGDGARRRIVLVDSAAMVAPGDAGAIVVTGSHGGLVGGDPAMALRTDAFAAVFNDAGIGIEEAGSDGSRRSSGAASRRSPSRPPRRASARRVPPSRTASSRASTRPPPVSARSPGLRARDVLLAWAKG